jgi:hypothetical protein
VIQFNLPPRWKILRKRNNIGLVEVTAISTDQYTIKRRNWQEFIFLTDENTCFRMQDGVEAAYSDKEVGDWIIVGGAKNEEGDLIPKIVVYLPNDFNPDKIKGSRGRITNVDASGKTFT